MRSALLDAFLDVEIVVVERKDDGFEVNKILFDIARFGKAFWKPMPLLSSSLLLLLFLLCLLEIDWALVTLLQLALLLLIGNENDFFFPSFFP